MAPGAPTCGPNLWRLPSLQVGKNVLLHTFRSSNWIFTQASQVLGPRSTAVLQSANRYATRHRPFLLPPEKQQQIRAGSAASDGPETPAAYIKVIALEKFQKSKGKNAKRHSGSNKVDYGKRHILFKPQNNLGQV